MTGNMKMADLINSAPELLPVTERHGMSLGFGEATVEEWCSHEGKDDFTFLTICNIAVSETYRPLEAEIGKMRVADVTAFLRNSHDSYVYSLLPELERQISLVLVGRGESEKRVISEFFSKFKEGLGKHFKLEEDKIFPSLEALDRKGHGNEKIFRHEHGDIEEKIQDLINLLLKYVSYGSRDERVTELLAFLYRFREDLAIHSRIEDCLILPMIEGKLSPREKDILVCVARGMQNKEIAAKFDISVFTVMTHRKNITEKTGIKSIAGLTAYAILQGLIDIESIK